MEPRRNQMEGSVVERPRCHRVWAAFALCCGVGLIFAGPAAAGAAPLCDGQRATIFSNEATIAGTKGPDVIVGGRGPNEIFGAGGNDVICGGAGHDAIYGDRGNDTIDGKRGNDAIHGGRGSDDVDGGSDRDQVVGGSGNDGLYGGRGDRDEVDGGPGDDEAGGGPGAFDSLIGGVGRDRIDGGAGNHDIASYRGAGGPVAVDLGSGLVTGAEQERLAGIEDAVGGSGEDVLLGSDTTSNRLDGGPGDDRLLGLWRSDQAYGGPGSDQCVGPFSVEDSCGPAIGRRGTKIELYDSIVGSSSLTIAGDDGVDDVTVSRGDHGYVVRGGSGNPVLRSTPRSGGCASTAGSVSCVGPVSSILVSLGGGNDRLTVRGTVPAEVSVTVEGGPGRDWLRGGRGGDTLYAGDDSDPDTIAGGGGDDVLFGVNILHPRRNSGAATLVGGPGNDLLVGGQPCDDLFHGGLGDNDSASFARVRNAGTVVKAAIGGRVFDPEAAACGASRIDGTVEKIEGSTGPDVLLGSAGADTLLGRGGADLLDGRGGADRCIGGRGGDEDRRCEYAP
ncbi:MAG: calcium-binding protein [Solirubrobacterales bacterium]